MNKVFKSYYGRTEMYGLYAPSECGQFWRQWFSDTNKMYSLNVQSEIFQSEARSIVYSCQSLFNQKFIFKNLNLSVCLIELHKAFPDSTLIIVERDTNDILKSIRKARKKLNIPLHTEWSVKTNFTNDMQNFNHDQAIRGQIKLIRDVIKRDSKLWPSQNRINVKYEELDDVYFDEITQKIK